MLPQLPPGFRFGTSTASYQIEGAATEDGKGPSIWDTFTSQPGRIVDGSSGEVACDHFHRYPEDIALMKRLGAGGYRFSLSWPRIQPTGAGAPNEKGLEFYDRLLDGLLEAGVQPMVTLYHWDLPQALEDDGGWLNRATIDRFADFAAIVGERFADRVEHWIPVNEPNVVTMLGYSTGMHAPGRTLMFDALPVAHHLLLAHGRAAIALRAAGATSVGCANNHAPIWPASDDAADVGASKLFDALWNGMYVEPMLLGRYPADLAPLLEDVVRDGDLATIRQPLDFYGVNYYNPMKIAAAGEESEMPFEFRELVGYPTTDFGWPVVPDGLREWLITLRARFRAALPPLMITESGCSYAMGPDADGVVDDQPRIDYHEAHLRAIATAIQRGVDVRGYYAWSLLDNFEWAEGYTQRFGLVHVDYETQVRTPKRSFEWFAALIAAQAQHPG
ncbi:beta-glucosidase [Nocardioides sp. KIGAM211]|uniref:Beta-glucosidase n=1 Tax=Nocardioides luti TaxID=2761101 RepID=A0A7X0RGS9_9ACTN|nr:beta-glucosidase [Nocardioides luti]